MRSNLSPLSYNQQSSWYRSTPQSAATNVASVLRIRSPLDLQALHAACQALMARHAMLRTTFCAETEPARRAFLLFGESQLRDHRQPEILEEVDASDWSWQKLKDWVVLASQRSFDLEQGPMWRVSVLTRAFDEYLLLLTSPYLACDESSMTIISQELQALYLVQIAGHKPVLAPLERSYADYVAWQSNMLQTEQQSGHQEWPVLNLPTDRPRGSVPSLAMVSHPFHLQGIYEEIKALAQQTGVSGDLILLAAFQVLLHRYTDQEEILVGFQVNERPVEFEGVVGNFVNTVVLRANLGKENGPTFQEFLGQVSQRVQAAQERNYPFELLARRQQAGAETAKALLQAMFIYQPRHSQNQNESASLWEPMDLGLPITARERAIELSLLINETEVGFSASFEYSSDLFEPATIQRMAGHFEILLAGIIANPHSPISELPLLPEAERRQLLVEWNDISTPPPANRCIHHWFEEQVERVPTAVAVVGSSLSSSVTSTSQPLPETRLTYHELNARANQLAHYLIKLGIGPEVLVGICLERSVEMMVGLLGILKAGGAYVPMDPTYPKERLAFMLQDTQVPVLLTQQKWLDHIGASDKTTTICLDSDWAAISAESKHNPVSGAKPEHLAYTIYTSGSTGRPKGVQINHFCVGHLVDVLGPMTRFEAQDVWTVFHSYAFDFSVWEIWACLLQGGRLVIVPHWMTRSPQAFYDLLDREKVTILNQTPSAIKSLIDLNSTASHQLSLRMIICGGEALPPTLVLPLLEWGVPVWNFYGPTEATVWTTIKQVEHEDSKRSWLPIGRPFATRQVYILDRNLSPVPVGVPGELHIGGPGLARGYFKRPVLTEEKFVPEGVADSFVSPESLGRLYKTGDLARYLPDGNVQFLGRLDHQVKVRGFRIELAEIEAVLAQHPQVREAVVIAREDNPGDKRLVAYLVPEKQAPSDLDLSDSGEQRAQWEKEVANKLTSELRTYLAQYLPDYMVPAAFVMLPALPLTPNKKINRRVLPAPPTNRADSKALVMPATCAEQRIAAEWQEALQLEMVGIHDTFFQLGGHSLLLAQVHQKLTQIFGQEITMVTLFQYPTIHALAKYLSQQQKEMADQTKNEQAQGKPDQPDPQALKRRSSKRKAGQRRKQRRRARGRSGGSSDDE